VLATVSCCCDIASASQVEEPLRQQQHPTNLEQPFVASEVGYCRHATCSLFRATDPPLPDEYIRELNGLQSLIA